ncbi:MAG TPA: hypothetical protein VFY13_09455 [Luteolibacter sp.]|nr:hypothetical protein [Luteolibacter sp.]
MKNLPLILLVTTCALATSSAENRPKDAERAEHKERKEAKQAQANARKEAQEKEVAALRAALIKEVEEGPIQFEHSNTGLDLLRGRLSYAKPAEDGHGYVAYLRLEWGDLDKQIPNISPVYYSNWDGSVKLQQGGKGSVVKEFAFDDRDGTTGGVDGHDGLGRDSGRRPGGSGQPGAGSGRDALIRDDGSIVAWKSGVVGATDGLMIRLELKQAATRGVIQAGNFTIPFETSAQP